jgi:hypothetical protein
MKLLMDKYITIPIGNNIVTDLLAINSNVLSLGGMNQEGTHMIYALRDTSIIEGKDYKFVNIAASAKNALTTKFPDIEFHTEMPVWWVPQS